ncbi:MAG TPA: hypothetical protein VLB83_00070 [Candidatus Paceibacterota bacterium]|nr:hypothetical protein [Candidatus Paceibacterota bacterium]
MQRLAHIVFGLVMIPTVVFAHGFGQTIQQESNGYLLAVDSASETLIAGSAERIGFDITPKVGTGTPAFSHVWIRIMSPDQTLLFAGFIVRSDIGQTGMTFAFPDEGTYEVALRFQDDATIVAEGTFLLPIAAGGTWESTKILQGIALLEFFALTILAVILATRKRTIAG